MGNIMSMGLRNEVQKVQADIDATTTRIQQLEVQLEALPSDAIVSERERYLQQSILHLRREKELLLQRLPPAQGAGDAQALTKYSRSSISFSEPSGLPPYVLLFWSRWSWAWWLPMVFLLHVQFGQRTISVSASATADLSLKLCSFGFVLA